MKKIWIINHYANPGVGRHANFGKELASKGYFVRIICAKKTSLKKSSFSSFQGVEEHVIDNVKFDIVPAKDHYGNGKDRILNILQFSYRAYKFLSKIKEKPDVIYASSVHPLNWVIGYLLSRKYKSKLIIETRDLWPETLIRMGRIKEESIVAKALYQLEKSIYKKADHLIFTMPGGEKYLKDRKLKYKNVSYINNGVDIKQFNYNAQNFVYEIDKEPNSFNVVYTGSMGMANALDIIIETAIKMKEQQNVYFHFFGDGYQREKLESFASENNLKNVKFYGRVEREYIPSILKQADVNIATSLNLSIYEYGISLNKLFEYFAAEKPIISNIPTPYNKIEYYETGITAEPESVDALVVAINQISILDSKNYNILCNNAKKTALLYDYKKLVDKLEEIIT